MIQHAYELEWPVTWPEAETFAWRLTDRLGCPIDAGILETVVALNLLGFRTSQSCEGHLDGGLACPRIDFTTEECPVWYEQVQKDVCRDGQSPEEEEAAIGRLMALVAEFHHENHLYTRLSALLEAFYAPGAQDDNAWQIILHCMHPGYYRLCPRLRI